MNFHLRSDVSGVFLLGSVFLGLAASPVLRAEDTQALLQSDRALLQAFTNSDKAALAPLLDSSFTWINSNGVRLTRQQVLDNLPAVANSGVETQARSYGNSAIVRANRGAMNVLRVWVRRGSAWCLIHYQEVLQVPKSEAPAADPGSVVCENPCKTIPFQPETQSEKEAISSWQGVMKAMSENDADAYVSLIADEFTATDTHHDHPYAKPDRIAQIKKQKLAGNRSVPPALLSAQMFDFGDTVMMIAHEQRLNAKAFFNTRMWVKRDGRWQMLFSFNTRIE
jgi:ketosteroid isomerase-like protein